MKRRTDSVPAVLTPREAVLNRNAAEILGRDTIKRLNDHGNMLSKRGVDLASDPTPGPSTINLLGYQMGTEDVRRDDRADLLAEANNTFYGGGQAPAPTPTPTPKPRGYAYGTEDVKKKRTGAGITQRNVYPDNPVSTSRYLGLNGTDLGPQYDETGGVNPLPKGAIGVQGARNATAFNRSLGGSQPSFATNPSPSVSMSHTDMATDIARRNLTATGSQLGNPQPQTSSLPSNVSQNITPEQAAEQGLQWTGGNVGWQPYVSPQQMTDQNLTYTGGPSSGSVNAPSQQTVHFLPPGFTATTGSTGLPNSTPNDIHFLPPGFTSVQGSVDSQSKQLRFVPQKKEDEGYGSAYGY